MKIRYGRKCLSGLLLLAIAFSGIFTSQVSAEYDGESVEAISENIKISSRFYELLAGKEKNNDVLTLGVGGYAIGLKINERGVLIRESELITALHKGDRIMKLDGIEVNSKEEISDILNKSCGKGICFEILREGETLKINVNPVFENGEYKLGLNLRSGASGIGTVSFIDPETGIFAGLGHGICDTGGEVIPIRSGKVTSVLLGTVKKGEAGKPGELTGMIGAHELGNISKNTELGIFGQLNNINKEELLVLPVAEKSEVKNAEAEILCTLRGESREKYKVEIYDIDYSSDGAKSFKVRVCDPKLTAITGGIVRGMSGSPIIQNGKIVGALTHVMVSDPSSGYGIFVENMLGAMKAK